MGKPTGFIEYDRQLPTRRPVEERLGDWREIYQPFAPTELNHQAARCMDCGVPTCHSGCPLGNLIPEWNDHVYTGDWESALEALHATNNFPEFTGRLCPAPCEEACVLSINAKPVAIEEIEKQIIEKGFQQDWIRAVKPPTRSGKSVAIIGSGPAGLAAAQQLNRVGHSVTVFERDEAIGGLLRFGIPDFKMEKHVIDRRLRLLQLEGIQFETNVNVGVNYPASDLTQFDAVLLTTGSTVPRDLPIPGRELAGIYPAMEYLCQQNRRNAGNQSDQAVISAKDKHVVVIGGGDTGSDCIGTANRQGARSVTNFELLPQPPTQRGDDQPWPYWPMRLRTSSSHEEGVTRHWAILTTEFSGTDSVQSLSTIDVKFVVENGKRQLRQLAGTEKQMPADLVLLAMGFTGTEPSLPEQLGIGLADNGSIRTTQFSTDVPGIFAAGDSNRGQSLIVWAISEGREAARVIDQYLMSRYSALPSKGAGDLTPG